MYLVKEHTSVCLDVCTERCGSLTDTCLRLLFAWQTILSLVDNSSTTFLQVDKCIQMSGVYILCDI